MMKQNIPLWVSQNNFVALHKLPAILNQTNLTNADTVLDIGSGKGGLFNYLSRKVNKVYAIEKDLGLHSIAIEQYGKIENICFLNEDILGLEFASFGTCKVFSNIPFAFTSDILKKIHDSYNISEAYIFMQYVSLLRYGGEQVGAQWNDMKAAQWFPSFKIEKFYKLSPHDFDPIPTVDIVISKFKRREKPILNNLNGYYDFIHYCFNKCSTFYELTQRLFTYNQRKKILNCCVPDILDK